MLRRIFCKKEKKENHWIKPGDRIRVTKDVVEYRYGEVWTLVATIGSIARAISFDEYCEIFNQYPAGEIRPEYVRKWMNEGKNFPFQYEVVVPTTTPLFSDEIQYVDCEIGGVVVLESEFFELIDQQE